VSAQARGYAASGVDEVTVVGRSQNVTGVRVVLRRAAWVTGTLYGTHGRPLANTGASVELSYARLEGAGGGSTGTYLTTDERGRYSIGALTPAKYELRLRVEGYASATRRFTITGTEHLDDVDSRFTEGTTLTARVLRPDGKPAAHAQATLYRVSGTSSFGGPTRETDETGLVRFADLGDGTYWVGSRRGRCGEPDSRRNGES